MQWLLLLPVLVIVTALMPSCVAQDTKAECRKLKESFDTPGAFKIHKDDDVKTSVPKAEIIKGIRMEDPRDAIPPIYDPEYESVEDAARHYDADDRVLVFEHEDTVLACAHKVLNRHEIVNDKIGELSFMIIY